MSFEHRSILISNGHFLTFIDFSFHKPTNVLLIAYFENTVSFRFIINPFSIIVEIPLVFAKSMPHSFLELPNINILASHQLSLSFIEIVLEVTNVLMHRIGKLTVSFLRPILKLPLVQLISIKIEATLSVSIVLYLTHIHMLCCQFPLITHELYLFPLQITRSPFAEYNFVLAPVIQCKFLLVYGQAIVIVFNEERRVYLIVHNVWYFLVVELQEVRERFGEQQSREGNGGNLSGDQWREVLSLPHCTLLPLLSHHLIVLIFLNVLTILTLVLLLVLGAVSHPESQTLSCLHDADQLTLQEVMESIPYHILTTLVP